ncbi:MAG: DNA-3-methyladenine glycosylase 2 family protein [Alphaproteobacteria bacterium]|nr:MAG: DNA-3-methyladenine glycosylase 2 family protein [Alphaproteobacteria bacterium]
MPRYRIISAEDDLREGAQALRRACPHMAAVLAETGLPPLRRRPNDFSGLARIIVGQQLSVSSAAAIWGRTQALVRPFSPAGLLAQEPGALRGCGLSAAKIRTLSALAQAIEEGALSLPALADADDDAVREALTMITGIGPWTADIYILFCLGRADGWAPGDLALQHAVRDALGRQDRPAAAAMEDIAARWRPWRGVAARALWAWYGIRRARAANPA